MKWKTAPSLNSQWMYPELGQWNTLHLNSLCSLARTNGKRFYAGCVEIWNTKDKIRGEMGEWFFLLLFSEKVRTFREQWQKIPWKMCSLRCYKVCSLNMLVVSPIVTDSIQVIHFLFMITKFVLSLLFPYLSDGKS